MMGINFGLRYFVRLPRRFVRRHVDVSRHVSQERRQAYLNAFFCRCLRHLRRTTLDHSKCLLLTSPAGEPRSGSEGRSVVAKPRNDASEGASRRSKRRTETEARSAVVDGSQRVECRAKLSDAQRRETKHRHVTNSES